MRGRQKAIPAELREPLADGRRLLFLPFAFRHPVILKSFFLTACEGWYFVARAVIMRFGLGDVFPRLSSLIFFLLALPIAL